MSIEQLISHSVPVLTPEDTVHKALDLLETNKLSAIPVITDEDYQAFLTEDILMEVGDTNATLAEAGLLQYKPAVSTLAHPFDAVSIMHQAKLHLLPVIDLENKYLGCITEETILGYIAENSGISNPGGVLVLEILPRNYSLVDIARICENEDVIMLAMHSRTNEHAMLEITLKLNRTVLDAVVSSFERHNYKVVEVYGKETNTEDIISKYNLLMNYINM
jgi:acetoin utilization protein AcuB